MTLNCDLYVDGHFEGKIESEKIITIGKNGKVNGEIRAGHLVVQGLVEGDVDVERIEIKESGRVSGIVTSSELVIEAKGHFQGESRIKGEEPQSIVIDEES
ncbi:MAG: polymer-forming cytoskeletal protein [Campylobacterota bacterium]|nr:polymer-forming cytoskeletal protein [Campylobacterota bacterium]